MEVPVALSDLIQNADQRYADAKGFSNPVLNKTATQFNESLLFWAQCTGEGVVVADIRKKILSTNPYVANLTKYCQSELESLSLDQLFKVHYKLWLKPKENHDGAQSIYQYRRFKAHISTKERKSIAVKGTLVKTRWFNQPAIILIFKAIKQTSRKEDALKHGFKKMRDLFLKERRQMTRVNQQLRQLQQVLDTKEHEVDHLKSELLDTSNALSALTRHLDKEKKAYESDISRSVITKILPILKTLQQDKKLSHYTLELNLLESYIGGLSPDGMKNQAIFSFLSETEGQIATLVKKGMTSKKIAALLCVSSETVRTHRRNIRKKLKIQNTNVNLRTYLTQISTTSL
jgi:predicted transcriptional regulator